MFWASPDFSSFGPAYQQFLSKYEAKYNLPKPIHIYHAHAYDAMGMILAAIEKVEVKDPDGTLHIGREALRDALFAVKGYQGLTGTLNCLGRCSVDQEHSTLFRLNQRSVLIGVTPLPGACHPYRGASRKAGN